MSHEGHLMLLLLLVVLEHGVILIWGTCCVQHSSINCLGLLARDGGGHLSSVICDLDCGDVSTYSTSHITTACEHSVQAQAAGTYHVAACLPACLPRLSRPLSTLSRTRHLPCTCTPHPPTPPEQATSKCDVYSFGVLMYEVATGQMPHQDVLNMARGASAAQHMQLVRATLVLRVGHQGLRPTFPPWVPADYVELSQRCWAQDPELRPDFNEVTRVVEAMRERYAEDAATHEAEAMGEGMAGGLAAGAQVVGPADVTPQFLSEGMATPVLGRTRS